MHQIPAICRQHHRALESLEKKGAAARGNIHYAHVGSVVRSKEILHHIRVCVYRQSIGCFRSCGVLNAVIRIETQHFEPAFRRKRHDSAEASLARRRFVHRREYLGVIVPDVERRSLEIDYRRVFGRHLLVKAQHYAGGFVGERQPCALADYPALGKILRSGIDKKPAPLGVGKVEAEGGCAVGFFFLGCGKEGKARRGVVEHKAAILFGSFVQAGTRIGFKIVEDH